MSLHIRICSGCGKSEETGSYAPKCRMCFEDDKRQIKLQQELKDMDTWGYDVLSGPTWNEELGKRYYEVKRRSCGHSWIVQFSNLLKGMETSPNSPCKKCGGKERMSKAMAAFIEKYRIKDYSEWREYSKHVRKLTEATYKTNWFKINPLNLKRGKNYHLDHRKAIVQCFLDGDPPEYAARLENLQMLRAVVNLSKGRK